MVDGQYESIGARAALVARIVIVERVVRSGSIGTNHGLSCVVSSPSVGLAGSGLDEVAAAVVDSQSQCDNVIAAILILSHIGFVGRVGSVGAYAVVTNPPSVAVASGAAFGGVCHRMLSDDEVFNTVVGVDSVIHIICMLVIEVSGFSVEGLASPGVAGGCGADIGSLNFAVVVVDIDGDVVDTVAECLSSEVDSVDLGQAGEFAAFVIGHRPVIGSALPGQCAFAHGEVDGSHGIPDSVEREL